MTSAEKVVQLEGHMHVLLCVFFLQCRIYARGTVAFTRARRLCVLLCPLDQKGSIGAATILGCLHGLGHLRLSQLTMQW